MAHNVHVSVPKSAGDVITVSYGGGNPISYKVHDGQVTLAESHVAKFISSVEGAKRVESEHPVHRAHKENE